MKKIITLLLTLLLVLTCSACTNKKVVNRELREVFEYVYDAGTYTNLDYDFAQKYFIEHYDNYGGGCTAVAKTISNGDTIVGRNMDLNISNKCAYIFRTDVEGCYKTVNLMYTFRDFSPDYLEVKENGLPDEFEKIMPFLADDVLNEKGLYVEVNMRNGEYWPTGDPKFSCKGTNPDSNERVYMFTLSRYIGEHCANVDEAIEYVKTLDVYSQNGYWNYCFLMADANGRYGVLEFAMDEVIWHDYQPAQANFYIDADMQAIEELRAGVGRYNNVMLGREFVDSEEDMFELMDSVSYFQFYDYKNCKFDWRSENVGALAFATYNFVTNDEYADFINYQMELMCNEVKAKSRQELRNANEYWESAFTEVINCNKRKLFVRFYEDDSKTYTLGFSE